MNLKDEILEGESPTLEFKRDIPDQALKYLKTVSAFANCSGGRIVFGVDSDLSICGMDEAFAYMHVAEKWGLGIPNAMHEFVEHGLSAPEYTDWGNAVKVTVRRLPKEPNDTVNDTVDVSLNNLSEGQSHQTSSNNETSQPSNVSLNVPLKSRNVSLHDAIVALVRDNPGINRKNLAFHLKVTVKTIDRLLPSLANVERRGSKKTGGYYCK